VSPGLILAENGETDYRIVISQNASPSEKYAANELKHFLRSISGADIPIVTDKEEIDEKEILIGDSLHLENLKDIDVDFRALGDEGFIIKTLGKYLIIVGGRLRGTMYGVYTFLEKYLGCRWFTSKMSMIPRMDKLVIGEIDDVQVPVLEYREPFYTDAFDADWAVRNKVNGNFAKIDKNRGGRVKYYPFVHSFDKLIPRELYETHPEYFPLIDGKRVDGYAQRCLSNPDVIKLAIKRVKEWIKQHPDVKIISVSQNDTGKWCQCPDCRALDESEGTPAASIINFVDKVAEAIEKEYPDKYIDTLAYQYSRKPPKTLRPRENVIIRLCTIECCFSHPLETCDSKENQEFKKDIVGWSRLTDNLYVWDYVTNFAHYLMPFPNLYSLKPNIKFFIKHNVKGIFEEGNYSPGGHGEFAELRAYILAKLLWNPDTDVDILIDEFLEYYYSKAAKPIREYIDMIYSIVMKKNIHVHIFDPPTSSFLNDDVLEKADQLFDEAEKMADSEEIRLRVKVARLPIQYVILVTNRLERDDRKKLLDEFVTIARKVGLTHISERKTLEDWIKEQIY